MAKDPLTDMVQSVVSNNGKPDPFGQSIEAVLAHLWDFRSELGLAALLGAVFAGLAVGLHEVPLVAGIQTGAGAIALLAVPQVRRAVLRLLSASRIRRRWDMAVQHCNLRPTGTMAFGSQGRRLRGVRVRRVERTWAGYRLHLRLSHGLSFDAISRQQRPLEAALRVAELRVRQDPQNASRGTVTLIKRSLGTSLGSFEVPEDTPSLWDPIPLGMDEHGSPVDITLVQKHLLIGGITGAGKSVALSIPLARAALDPTVQMYLLDAKGGVEFAPWRRCAREFATNINDGITALEGVARELHRRLEAMTALGEREGRIVREIERGLGWPLIFVAIDELARFTEHGDKKLRDQFNGLLEEVVALGRAPGVIVCAATQKPEGNVVPTRIRDLFAYRLALRCSTPQASDTILGQGWAAQGSNAQRISEDEKGVGYLLSEDASPIRMRVNHLKDAGLYALAQRAQEGRKA